MTRINPSPNFAAYLTVGEAAQFLGVSTATLRNWDRSGKLKPRRHPQNDYRIYLHEDLEAVLRSADVNDLTDDWFAPQVDWTAMRESDHFVQFYENDEFLIESVCGFVGAALTARRGSIAITTDEHGSQLRRKLTACGIDIAESIESGQFVMLSAVETLSKFMRKGMPDRQLFQEVIGTRVSRMTAAGRRLHAFGEMVAVLWAEGNRAAAIRLEELWNELGQSHRFTLFCAYPIAGFGDSHDASALGGVCACHSRTLPSESYAALETVEDRMRAVALLQQKAHSLAAEIEHRNEVQQALSERERELADFFENATEGLHKVGPDGTILWANKSECDLLGYSIEEYVGRSICDFHVDAEVIADILTQLRRGQSLENYPARLRCKNGMIKQVLINSNACFQDGEFLYTRCFTRDVTREWQAEQALREADRRKDEFLATLAHELRNPLAPLRNALELLNICDGNEKGSEEARGIMGRQVEQMSRLVDDLLDVSRITRDKIELRKQRIDLAIVLNNALETSRPMIEASGHALSVSIPQEPIYIDADATRIAQVFSNLLNNSAKYTEPGGQIWLNVRKSSDEVTISVRDNGLGISCEALAYVFDMFRQADRSLNRAQGGLGVGLTLVRRLVELHDGRVEALSEGPGKGSEFIVHLPTQPPPAKHGIPSMEGQSRGNPDRLRILVVDDNLDSGKTMHTLLRVKGHDVRLACDGIEAVAMANEFRPEVILMDVGMPKMDGYEATRQIRRTDWGADTFIIALTGWGQVEDMQRSAEAGCSAHIVKPVNITELDELISIRTSK